MMPFMRVPIEETVSPEELNDMSGAASAGLAIVFICSQETTVNAVSQTKQVNMSGQVILVGSLPEIGCFIAKAFFYVERCFKKRLGLAVAKLDQMATTSKSVGTDL